MCRPTLLAWIEGDLARLRPDVLLQRVSPAVVRDQNLDVVVDLEIDQGGRVVLKVDIVGGVGGDERSTKVTKCG